MQCGIDIGNQHRIILYWHSRIWRSGTPIRSKRSVYSAARLQDGSPESARKNGFTRSPRSATLSCVLTRLNELLAYALFGRSIAVISDNVPAGRQVPAVSQRRAIGCNWSTSCRRQNPNSDTTANLTLIPWRVRRRRRAGASLRAVSVLRRARGAPEDSCAYFGSRPGPQRVAPAVGQCPRGRCAARCRGRLSAPTARG